MDKRDGSLGSSCSGSPDWRLSVCMDYVLHTFVSCYRQSPMQWKDPLNERWTREEGEKYTTTYLPVRSYRFTWHTPSSREEGSAVQNSRNSSTTSWTCRLRWWWRQSRGLPWFSFNPTVKSASWSVARRILVENKLDWPFVSSRNE